LIIDIPARVETHGRASVREMWVRIRRDARPCVCTSAPCVVYAAKNKKHLSFTLETFNIILYFCRRKQLQKNMKLHIFILIIWFFV